MPYAGLNGKVALVTGAARGIGAATCRRLAEEDCKVAAVDVLAEELAQSCAALPGEVAPIVADVSREVDCDRMVADAVARFGALDLFVNNAGVIGPRLPITEMPVEEFIALNPAYHRPLIKGNQDTQLVVPADKVEPFLKNLARHEAQAKPLANWRTHVLAKGEKLERVAARYGLGLAYLKQLNGIGAKSKMHAGLNLLVPGPGAQLPEQLAAHLPKLPVEPAKAKPGQSVKSAKGKSGKSVEPVKVKAKTGQSAKAVKSKPKTKPEASTRKPVKGKPR